MGGSEMVFTSFVENVLGDMLCWMLPGHVGSVTNSASRSVQLQNEIVASAANLGCVGGKLGRVGGTFD